MSTLTSSKPLPSLPHMEIIKEPKSNFLHQTHYRLGLSTALIWPLVSFFVSTLLWSDFFPQFKATPELVFKHHEYWRLLVGFLAHGDLNHFLSNSLFLSVLSFFIARTYGATVLFGLGTAMGILTHFITLLLMPDHVSLVGASGLVYAFWGFWFSLYFLIDRYTPLYRRFMKIAAISILLLIPHSFEPQVSYLAHFNGFAIGLISGVLLFLLKKKKIRSFEKFRYLLEPSPYLTNEEYEEDYWKIEES